MKKIKIELFMFMFLILSTITLVGDYITYIINLNYIFSLIFSTIIVLFLLFILRKKMEIKFSRSKVDCLFFLPLLVLFTITIVFPDQMFDTLNYHLYLQENPFNNKIFDDFFASRNLNSFTFSFADRMFYIFRYFLGYRLGVILNYLVIITMYYQVKKIFENIFTKQNTIYIAIFSTLTVFGLSILEHIDSYYVDNLSIILLLELIIITLFSKKEKNEISGLEMAYIGLLSGFAAVIKVSNVFIILTIAILYFIMRYKDIFKAKIKNIIKMPLLALIPLLPYIVYNYISTGNPLFPFYNTIFKSEYFSNTNWMDTRFGPKNILELILWPFIAYLEPSRTADTHILEPMWFIGYVSVICLIIITLVKIIRKIDYNKTALIFYVFTLASYLVWAQFLLGYSRYGLLVLILGSISTFILIKELFEKRKYVIFALFSIMLIYNYGYTIKKYVFSNTNFYNNIFNNGIESYKYNLKNLFSDSIENIDFLESSVWGIVYNNAGFAELINDDMPIITLGSGVSTDLTNEIFTSTISKYDHIYTLINAAERDNFYSTINQLGYKIVDITAVIEPYFVNQNEQIYIFEIEKAENYINSEIQFSNDYEIITNDSEHAQFFIGLNRYAKYSLDDGNIVTINAITDYGNIFIGSYEINTLNFYKINIELPEETNYLVVDSSLEDNINLEIINLELTEE